MKRIHLLSSPSCSGRVRRGGTSTGARPTRRAPCRAISRATSSLSPRRRAGSSRRSRQGGLRRLARRGRRRARQDDPAGAARRGFGKTRAGAVDPHQPEGRPAASRADRRPPGTGGPGKGGPDYSRREFERQTILERGIAATAQLDNAKAASTVTSLRLPRRSARSKRLGSARGPGRSRPPRRQSRRPPRPCCKPRPGSPSARSSRPRSPSSRTSSSGPERWWTPASRS